MTSSDKIVKRASVKYLQKEYDPTSKASSSSIASKDSNAATYLANTLKEFEIDSLLVDSGDAAISANRWAFMFEVASAIIKIETKLQGSTLNINDKIAITHEKLYQRVGSSQTRKVATVQASSRSLVESRLDIYDLANAFTRCAVITDAGASEWDASTETERSIRGYITDSYGLQANNADTYSINLLW